MNLFYQQVWLLVLAVGIVLAVFAAVLQTIKIKKRKHNMPLQRRNILTKNEYVFWRVFSKKAAQHSLLICPKVRMEDFLSVTSKDARQRQSWRARIKSRHIDFILCDKDMNMLAGVELDDNSHKYSKPTIEADKFKNAVFEQIDIPLYRIIVSKGNYDDQLKEMFCSMRVLKLIK